MKNKPQDVNFNEQKAYQTLKPRHTIKSHLKSVLSSHFHSESKYLITGSEDCTVKMWNIEKLSKNK